jgi:hypothetical protein
MDKTVAAFIPIVGILVPISAIVGGLALAAFAMYLKARARQMVHRERLAMIERGLTPPLDPVRDVPVAARWIRNGIIVTFSGLGMALMIAFASNANALRQALGIGGMLVLLGLSFFLVGYVESRRARSLDAGSKPVD